MIVGPAGVGARKAAGGRTDVGPVMIRGAWAVAAREKARAAIVSEENTQRWCGENSVCEKEENEKQRKQKKQEE